MDKEGFANRPLIAHRLPLCELEKDHSFLAKGSQSGGNFGSYGIFGNNWTHFGLLQLKSAIGLEWVQVRDAAKHPEMHRKAPEHQIISWSKMSTVVMLRNAVAGGKYSELD